MQGVAKDPSKDKRHSHPTIDRNIDPLPGEIWVDVKEWKGHELQPNYQVSNLGRVRNLGRVQYQKDQFGRLIRHPYPACMLRKSLDSDGYEFIVFRTAEKKTSDARVHQLVAVFFLGEHRPDQFQVNHIDGNKKNNCVSNLEWASPSENNAHARQTGLARLGTSQAIHGYIEEWDTTFSSKTKTNAALGWSADYIDRCLAKGNPIIDKNTGQEVHVRWIDTRKETADNEE